jgi:hypothetical protein
MIKGQCMVVAFCMLTITSAKAQYTNPKHMTLGHWNSPWISMDATDIYFPCLIRRICADPW